MQKHKFTSEKLTPTKWDSAENKAKWLNQLADFVRSGFQESKFTKGLYNRLSMTFGHIAHYNKNGFYGTWFEDEGKRLNWIYYVQEHMCYGDPAYTWSDAEKQFIAWLKSEEGTSMCVERWKRTKSKLERKLKSELLASSDLLERLDNEG